MGTIVKRGDNYREVIRKKGHKPITKTFSKMVLARKWVQDTEYELDRQEVYSDEVPIGILIDKYVKDIVMVNPPARNSIRRYEQISRWTRRLRLSDLNFDALMAWKAEYAPDVTPGAFNAYLSIIFRVVKAANVFWNIDIPSREITKAKYLLKHAGAVNSGKVRDRRPTADELDLLCAPHGTAMTIPLSDMIELSVAIGLREGEICRLLWSDLDEDNKMLLVRDRKHPTKKIGNHNNVPLLFGSLEILKRQKRRPGVDRIFPHMPESVSRAFARRCVKLEIEDLRFHDMRHEAISRMFERGFSIPEVALVSGHRSWSNLKRYTNLKPESLHAKDLTKKIPTGVGGDFQGGGSEGGLTK